MILKDTLDFCGIRTALIVDDAIDDVPLAADLAVREAWSSFNDDLTNEQLALIKAKYSAEEDFSIKITRDEYVAAVWSLREELGEVSEPLFQDYISSRQADLQYVNLICDHLSQLGIACSQRGRFFEDIAQDVDLIVIDLYLGGAQTKEAYDHSKQLLKAAIEKRSSSPPLVLLMSRNHSLKASRDDFRDEVGLIDSGFRILQKSDLKTPQILDRQLERLARNAADTRKLALFFNSLKVGIENASVRTLQAMRRLKLSDISQIQQLLLQFEGEPTGSYLVDIFDRLLQHEIEADNDIIVSATNLNAFTEAQHPTPYVAGSPQLQDLVQRTLTQNFQRLSLRTSPDYPVAFGDVLLVTTPNDLENSGNKKDRNDETVATLFPGDLKNGDVLVALTPACDLQRGAAPRVMLLVGKINHLDRKTWISRSDARTPAIKINDETVWIKWDLKHINTVPWDQLRKAFTSGTISLVARLREAHALELQQKLLAGLGRVGLVAPLPATFPVSVQAFVPDSEGIPRILDIPALNDEAVCFVGRDKDSNTILKLMITEDGCDGLEDALQKLPDSDIAPDSLKAINHIRSTTELGSLLISGINISSLNNTPIMSIAATGTHGVTHMARIYWKQTVPDTPLMTRDLKTSGVILSISDIEQKPGSPSLTDVIQLKEIQLAADKQL